jgi:hypothetical protein
MISRKFIFGGLIIFLAFGLGMFFLIRGCLSKYDERSAITPSLLFEADGKPVIFSICRFEKTTSYSRKGNMVRKSVNVSYSLQTNDGITAALLANKKIKSNKKSYTVEILGTAGNQAWIFYGEPQAFDIHTLEKTADIEILESKNPGLKNKFPTESRYYQLNEDGSQLFFTAIDGSKWLINTNTLLASANETEESSTDKNLSHLIQQIKLNKEAIDTNYQQNSSYPASLYKEKKIDYNQLKEYQELFLKNRTALYAIRDSLYNLQRNWEHTNDETENQKRKIESLNRTGLSYEQMFINQDTLNNKWYGLYSAAEFSDLSERFYESNAHDETARRNLIFGNYLKSNKSYSDFDKDAVTKNSESYLNGGFLLNKATGRPIFLKNKNAYLIVFKDQIGREGKIQISLASIDNKKEWQLSTGLTTWANWKYRGNRLYVWGTDNKDLSSNEVNLLLCINLDNGSMTSFDYFKNSTRK